MKYKEFKNAVEDWGRVYGYKPTVNVGSIYIDILFEHVYYTNTVCTIHKSERCVIDLNWKLYRNLSENAKHHLFEIVTEFAATKPEDREDKELYYVKILDNYMGYLNKPRFENLCLITTKAENDLYRTKFTEKEIKEIDERFWQFAEEVEG